MHKLIRDRIPELMGEDGIDPQFATIESDSLYSDLLFNKLREEVTELCEARSASNQTKEMIYEMCDILEVLDAIKVLYNIDEKTLQYEKKQKAQLKGKFEKRYIGFFED